jgi:uncharacterized protein YbjQ (UPF0145 family)
MTGPMSNEVLRNRMLAGQVAATQRNAPGAHQDSRLSGLSVNENLLLGSIGWESIDLCSGAAVWGMRRDTVNTWGADQDARASLAFGEAMRGAVDQLEANCRASGGHGVIGVDIHTEIEPRYVSVNILGTAVRPDGNSKVPGRAFTSNLTPQSFVLLREAGWEVLGLTSGCRFVRSYRRSATQTVMQKVQNVELTNPTQALATARAETMIQLEERARAFGGQGVIEVSLSSGPVRFATHVQSFAAWGTVVASASSDGQRHPSPRVAMSMNDLDQGFEASASIVRPRVFDAE